MARPAPAIPLDEAALCIAAHVQPALDIAAYLRRLDELAARCTNPTLDGLLAVLFGHDGFSGNANAYYDTANSCLDQVIDRRTGIPITLAVLTMEVGRRVGVPLDGVGMPGHFLLRDKVDMSVFVDPFDRGRILDRLACRRLFDAVTGGRLEWQDEYLEAVPRNTIVERMLANLKAIYARANDLDGLRWVIRLRLACPGVDQRIERLELARLMASTN